MNPKPYKCKASTIPVELFFMFFMLFQSLLRLVLIWQTVLSISHYGRHTYNPRTQEAEARDCCEFEANLGHKAEF